MRRTVIIGAACALLVSAVAWATQLWRDNQSGADAYSLSHITSLQVNNGAGSGTRCAQFDSAGNLLPASAACSAGFGGASGVTSATGTAQRVSVTPTTGAVVVDTIGGYYSGAVSGGNEDLGTTLTNGLVCDTTTAGVAVLRTCSAGTDYVASLAVTGPIVNNGTAANPNIGVALPDAQVAYGLSGTNVTSSAKMTYVDANPLLLLNNGIGTSTVWVDAGTAAAQGGGFFRAYSVGFPVPSLSQSVAFGNDTGAGSLGVTVFGNSVSASGGAGYVSLRGGGYDTGAENILCDKNGAHLEGSVFDSALTTNGLMKTTGGTGLHATATAGTDYQAPLVACTDYVHIACQSGTSDLAGTDGAVHVDALHDGVGNQHTTTGSWGAHQLLQTDALGSIAVGGAACSDLPALTGTDGIATAGGTCTVTNSFKGKVLATGADPNPPDSLINKLESSNSTINVGVGAAGALVDLTVTSTLVPFDYVATYGGANFVVDLPPLAFTGANPDFWLRPNAGFSTAAGGPSNFATQGQVWEVDTDGAYGHVDLRSFVYTCGITTTGGVNDLTLTVTKNGTNTSVASVVSCPAAIASNVDYSATGTVSFGATDRVGIRATVTNTGVYSTGAFRATVHVRLRP